MAERLPGVPSDYAPGQYNIPPSIPASGAADVTPLQAALSAAGLLLGDVFSGGTPIGQPTYNAVPYSSYYTRYATPPWVARQPRAFLGPDQIPGNRDDKMSFFVGTDMQGGSLDDRVYMGKQTTEVPQPHIGIPGEGPAGVGPEAAPDSITVEQAFNQPYLWDDEKVEETMKKMRASGEDVSTFEEMMEVWKSMVIRASRTFTLSNGDRLVTPWDMLTAMKKENVDAGVIDKDGNIVQHQTQRSVYEVSDEDALATLRSAMTDMLGRAPDDQEVKDFASRMTNLAQQDPTVTKTTTRTDPESGDVESTSHTNDGFDQSDMAMEAVEDLEDNPEYGAYQAAAMYFNALESAIGPMF